MIKRCTGAFALLLLLFVAIPSRADTLPKAVARPRVLILGDSISIGYTPIVRQNLAGQAEVFRPNENCQHTAHGLAQIKKWLGTEKWDVIHFNWGIWDTHILDSRNHLVLNEANAAGELHLRHTPEQYRENLVRLVKTLEGTGAKLIFASTTPVMSRSGKRFDDIANLNRVALEVMRQHKIAVNDLYQTVLPNAGKWQTADKVHFNDEGNAQLGKLVSDSIHKQLTTEAKASPPAAAPEKIPSKSAR